MAKREYWVLIETNDDRLDNPDKPDINGIQEVLYNPVNYVIHDVCDINDLTVKTDTQS